MDERYKAITVKREDYIKLKEIAEKTRRTISGTVSYLIDTSGLFLPPKSPSKVKEI